MIMVLAMGLARTGTRLRRVRVRVPVSVSVSVSSRLRLHLRRRRLWLARASSFVQKVTVYSITCLDRQRQRYFAHIQDGQVSRLRRASSPRIRGQCDTMPVGGASTQARAVRGIAAQGGVARAVGNRNVLGYSGTRGAFVRCRFKGLVCLYTSSLAIEDAIRGCSKKSNVGGNEVTHWGPQHSYICTMVRRRPVLSSCQCLAFLP